ncbi:uncharacterized protein LOC126845513 [Adelges cooleyi]|uniref:uncharacterized protein LOC126845513 n=1 Tax=Adelges cooleyi TaxID=133065 RepID=UPI00217FEE6E|nr:uncharacterized protein LOC126845513 [Adelges cooleyi]
MTNIKFFILLCLTFYTPSVNSESTEEILDRTLLKILTHVNQHQRNIQITGITLRQFMDYVGKATNTEKTVLLVVQQQRYLVDAADKITITKNEFEALITDICLELGTTISTYTGLIETAIDSKQINTILNLVKIEER